MSYEDSRKTHSLQVPQSPRYKIQPMDARLFSGHSSKDDDDDDDSGLGYQNTLVSIVRNFTITMC